MQSTKANSALALKFVLALGLAGVSAACATNTKQKGLAYVERPVEQIYNDAVHQLDRHVWQQAATQFDEVERQHPYSVWAQRSMLMAAYARYKGHDYDKSISSTQEYISLHPGGNGAPYAYYLIAVCQFDQIIDVGREQARSELALAALNEVAQRFPESSYARDAALKTDMVKDQLAGKEMEIGRYYLRRNEQLAAINRFRKVVETYDTASHTPEALYRLVESYLSIGLKGQAQASAAVLGYNYPGSQWYGDAYRLMTEAGVEAPKPTNDINLIKRMWDTAFPKKS